VRNSVENSEKQGRNLDSIIPARKLRAFLATDSDLPEKLNIAHWKSLFKPMPFITIP
jgi:hypothetical protein